VREALICEPVAHAGRSIRRVFRDVPAHVLGATVIARLLERTKLPSDAVDDVLFAQCYSSMDATGAGPCGLRSMPAYPCTPRVFSSTVGADPDYKPSSMHDASGNRGFRHRDCGWRGIDEHAPFYTTQARWGIKGEALGAVGFARARPGHRGGDILKCLEE